MSAQRRLVSGLSLFRKRFGLAASDSGLLRAQRLGPKCRGGLPHELVIVVLKDNEFLTIIFAHFLVNKFLKCGNPKLWDFQRKSWNSAGITEGRGR